ncbi:bacterial sugar transferase [Schaalia georgiae F0490]|uniref:Bacterial sugar transferase n=2 Tax=Schaalia georgiae TaxID=52768 RepID=J0NL79_9ACTO|nr:sugar transferase [Schaalia georgiae]EJF47914.1 bacterial sugar transferase [Schaalia georgiae F0490]
MTTLTNSRAKRYMPTFVVPSAARGSALDLAFKRVIDIVLAAVGVAVLTPLWLVVALLIRISDHGPAFFKQTRVGKNGQPFTMYKFRTMRVDAEQVKASLEAANRADAGAGNSVMFKMRDDPRVTRVGRVLRKTSIDELPQLFNVIKGDMSLVGPRPPLPSEVATYEPHVMGKFAVRPGITGLWQISGRSNLSWEETVQLDLDYAATRTLGLDTWILLQTVPALLRQEGAY